MNYTPYSVANIFTTRAQGVQALTNVGINLPKTDISQSRALHDRYQVSNVVAITW